METSQLTGKVVEHWKKIVVDRPTICFAVNVHHSRLLVERFMQAGIPAEHCDADVPDKERNEIIARLERGETKVVCNVGIFCTGVDIPSLGAIIMARPTQSKNLFIQQAGRGTRPSPGKENCILLDHAGNIGRHGLPTDEPPVDLDGRIKEKSIGETKLCKECFCSYRGAKCPECGSEPPEVVREIKESDDELKELVESEVDPIKRALKDFLKQAKLKGWKPGAAYHKLVTRFGFDETKYLLPDWFVKTYETNQRNPFGLSPFKGVKI
jgi:superfamily II DNA or RNA helicase